MGQIKIHNESDFDGMRQAGRLAAETLDFVTPYVKEGVSTDELNTICHDFIVDNGAVPAPLNYRGFPKSVCTSVNHVVCHGIPDAKKKLRRGDMLNIDVTVILDSWHGDTSRMFVIGDKIPLKIKKLIDVTYQSMMHGIEQVRIGNRFGHIGHAIQTMVEGQKYSVVRDFCGHGLGRVFHDAPNVLHYGNVTDGAILEKGMFFTIEPMVNIGSPDVYILNDGWTAVTRDKKLSAQFEHSLGVREDGAEIFTLSPKGFHAPPYDT
jgi:methionyl aminopeptidase